MNLEIFKNKALQNLLESNGVDELKIFGSCVRNEETEDSDIDLLVTFKKNTGLFTLIRLERELGIILGRKIDLLTDKALHHKLKNQILSEAKEFFHAKR